MLKKTTTNLDTTLLPRKLNNVNKSEINWYYYKRRSAFNGDLITKRKIMSFNEIIRKSANVIRIIEELS